jgi:uncharacterized membrane protein YebE (DUF533 family)
MNFERPGWFDRYLEFRRAQPLPRALPTAGVRMFEQEGLHHEQDQATYLFLQPTGLLYGFPVAAPFPEQIYPEQAYLDEVGRVHLIWLDGLFTCLMADRTYLLSGVREEADPFAHAVRTASAYFLEDSAAPRTGLAGTWERTRSTVERLTRGRSRALHPALEREIARRIRSGGDLLHVPQYAYNGFLFLDLYYCAAWQRALLLDPGQRHQARSALREQQGLVREALLRLLIAAAHASGDVDEGELRVFERFLLSAGLPQERIQRLRDEMRAGLTLDRIHIPEAPWLVRRHLLDLTLMLILADRSFMESEQAFAAELIRRLGLWDEELEQSQAALAAFLTRNEGTLHFLRARTQVGLLAERVAARAQVMLRKNLDRIVNEVRETRELYELLLKSRNETLTAEEKGKVRAQLFDILKTIPTLAIFALPGGSMALPILIRLLPFNLLPTSFED